VRADAQRLVTEWNERQAQRAPLLFSPTIGAAVAAQHWHLWVRCPACCMAKSIDVRRLDRHPDTMVTSLIPALSCRNCRPHAPFAELVRLSPRSIADEMREEHRKLGAHAEQRRPSELSNASRWLFVPGPLSVWLLTAQGGRG
jgi:hypothetical protein